MAGSKSTQTRFVRDKHLLYIPSLAFLDYCVPVNVDVFVECGRWEMTDGTVVTDVTVETGGTVATDVTVETGGTVVILM